MKQRTTDAELLAIDRLERDIVAAFDQRHRTCGTNEAEVQRLRPGVITLSATIRERLIAEYQARQS